MTVFRYSCPHCAKTNAISEGNVGHVIRCLHCQGRVDWDGEKPICAADQEVRLVKSRNWKAARWAILPLIISVAMLIQNGGRLIKAWQRQVHPVVVRHLVAFQRTFCGHRFGLLVGVAAAA